MTEEIERLRDGLRRTAEKAQEIVDTHPEYRETTLRHYQQAENREEKQEQEAAKKGK